MRIWARPYFEGREVDAGSNPSRLYEGEGEALAWLFFLGAPGRQVDEIRLSTGDGSSVGTHELERVRVGITAGTAPAQATAETGTALDSTSHNLWPFEILQASVVSLALIGAVTLARRFLGSRLRDTR